MDIEEFAADLDRSFPALAAAACSDRCSCCWPTANPSAWTTSPPPPTYRRPRPGQMLADLPDLETDVQGHIVGSGLTLRPTPHRFTIDGRQLYTWCALDTLIFPAVLGQVATVEAPC